MPSQRIWYFGARNERVIAFEGGEISWGNASGQQQTRTGRWPVTFVWLLTFVIPVWVVDRWIARRYSLSDDERELLLYATWVAPMVAPLVKDGAVLVRGRRIVAVGPAIELRRMHPAVAVTDLGNVVLLPGLVNAHIHLELSDRTAGAKPASFVDWLIGVIRTSPPPGDAGELAIAAATRSGIIQSLAAGVTTVGDITRNPAITRAILAESPLRAVSFGEVTAMASRRDLLEPRIAAAMSPSAAPDHVISAISPHAPYSIETTGYERCVAAARQAGAPIATHLAESAAEAAFLANHAGDFRRLWETIGGWDDCVPTFAGGPVRMAKAVGLLDTPHALLAHVNYADDDELALIAQGKASVVYCPRTHAYFGHPPHRWRQMLEMEINVAVGTDSLASSPSLDLVEDLRLMYVIAPDVPPAELWEMATVRGAAALGLSDRCGSISPGKSADLVAFPVRGTDDPLREVLERKVSPTGVWSRGQRVI